MSTSTRVVPCKSCGAELDKKYTAHIVMLPCNHVFCQACCIELLASRPMDDYCKCCCDAVVLGHRYTKPCNWKESNNEAATRNFPHTKPIIDCKKNPDRQKDPFRFFTKKEVAKQNHAGFIYLAIKDPKTKGKGNYLIHQSCFGTEGFEDHNGGNDLDSIFVFLHQYLIKQERPLVGQDEDNLTMNAADLLEHALDDQRTLLRCLYALGNGVCLTEKCLRSIREEERGFEKPSFMGSYAATDILFRLQQKNPCPLQRCLGETVYAMTGSKQLVELLSFFRIGTSTKPLVNAVNASWKSLPPMKLNPRDYHVASLDNLGFTDKKNVGYDHWVIFLFQIVKEETLKQLGFYHDAPDERISRNRKTLQEYISENGGHLDSATERTIRAAKRLSSVKKEDYAKESFYNLRQLEYCIEAELPTHQECLARIARNNFKTSYKLARNLGIDVSEKSRCCQKNGNVAIQQPMKYRGSVVTVGRGPGCASIIEANDYVLDTPVHDDLAKTSTVVDLMDYFTETCDKLLEESGQEEEEEPPVQAVNYAFAADGSPIKTALGVKTRDTEGKYSNLVPIFGGFHFMIQQVKMAAELTFEIRKHVIKGYRATTKKQEWVMNPSDPKQFEDEATSLMAAMWRAAVDSYAEFYSKEAVSPAEIHKHMIARAAEFPIANAVLIEYRWMVVFFMIRDCEISWSVDQYFATLRLVYQLCTVSNATNYTPMIAKLLLWWELASPADKILFENFVFVSKSAGGHNIFKDRAQEKVQLLYRNHLGKIKSPGLVKRMHYLTENLDKLTATKKSMKTIKGNDLVYSTTASVNETEIEVGEVYIRGYVVYREMFCWDPQRAPVVGGKKATRNSSPTILESPLGERMPSDLLKSWSIGKQIGLEYMTNVIREAGGLEDEVPEQEAKIRKLATRHSVIVEQAKLKEALRTATTVKELKKVRTKEPLIVELLRLKTLDPLAATAPLVGTRNKLKQAKVSDLVSLLVRFRKEYYKSKTKDGLDARKLELETLKAEHASSTSKQERETELQDPHYSLLKEQVLRFQRERTIGFKKR